MRSLLLIGFAAASPLQAQLVKVTYQRGTNGYTGTIDAAISTQNAQYTGGNGITSITTTPDGNNEFLVWKGPDYENRVLLRFEDLNIPAGSQVQAASIQLTFTNYDAHTAMQGHYPTVDWNPSSAPSNTGLGWLYRDSMLPWTEPGGLGAADVLADKSLNITNFSGQGIEIHKVTLDTTVVQGWLDHPTSNHGVILVGTVTGTSNARLFSSLAATAAYRPTLTLSYWPPGTGPVAVPQALLRCVPSANRQKVSLAWNSLPGALYQMQWSNDLKNWTTLPPLMVAVSATANWDDDGALTLTSPAQQASRFYRLATKDQPFFQPTGTAISFIPAATGSSVHWDFGDGTTASTPSITHSYAVDGPHSVSLAVTDGTGTHTVTCAVSTEAPCRVLLTPDVLAGLRQKALSNAPEWQDFQNRLYSRLAQITGNDGAYQGNDLELIGDYALGYKILELSDPATASSYADKAIGIIKSGLHDYQRASEMAQQFLARGDGVTKSFTLPNADLEPSSLSVYTGTVQTIPVTRSATDTADETDNYFQTFLKISNTPDGPADYQQGTDWRHNGDLRNNVVDWSGAMHQPAANAVYYLTEFSTVTSDLQTAPVTLSGNTITFDTAPASDQAIYVQYIYGTASADHSTLAWQQTSAGDGGFNSIYIDTGYTSRYLGKYLALGYDWLYDYAGFSTALKSETATMLVRWSDYWRDNGYHRNSPASNYSAGGYVSRMFTALALSGGRDSNGSRLTDEMTTYRQTYVVPLLTNPTDSYLGGFWAEGWNYGPLAAENLLLAGIAFERAGFGTATAERGWSTDVIGHLISAQPTQTTIYDGGDWYDYPAPFVPKEFMYLLGNATSDDTARSYANYIIQNYSGSQSQTMPDLVFRDPSAATSFWSAAPLQHFARGTGLITARNDWNYNSTWVSFQLGNILDTDHQAYAQGQLQIQRGADDLLVNLNAMAGNQQVDTESTYGNLVAIDDNGRGHQNYPFNEGFWFGTPGCRITNYEATAGYVYANGDYTASYSFNQTPGTGTATQLTRQTVYLRPDYVVVHDRASTVEADDPKQLRWHLLNPPTLNAANNSWVATAGNSKLFAQTFSSTVMTTTTAPVSDPYGDVTVSRVITTPSAPTLGVTWVSALQTAPSSTTTMVTTASLTSTDGRMEGVQMDSNVVLFGTHNAITPFSGSLQYTIHGTSSVTHLVTDLEPSRSYKVMAGSNLIGNLTSSDQGTLGFTSSPNGAQVITIQ